MCVFWLQRFYVENYDQKNSIKKRSLSLKHRQRCDWHKSCIIICKLSKFKPFYMKQYFPSSLHNVCQRCNGSHSTRLSVYLCFFFFFNSLHGTKKLPPWQLLLREENIKPPSSQLVFQGLIQVWFDVITGAVKNTPSLSACILVHIIHLSSCPPPRRRSAAVKTQLTWPTS